MNKVYIIAMITAIILSISGCGYNGNITGENGENPAKTMQEYNQKDISYQESEEESNIIHAEVIEYSDNLITCKVLLGDDNYNFDDIVVIANYRSKYPGEVVMSYDRLIITYKEYSEMTIIPEKISTLEYNL